MEHDDLEKWKRSIAAYERQLLRCVEGKLPNECIPSNLKIPESMKFEALDWYFTHTLEQIREYR